MVPSVATSSTTITQQPTHDPELVAELLKGPPEDFDFRAELTQGSREWVAANAPHLLDLVDDGERGALSSPCERAEQIRVAFRG